MNKQNTTASSRPAIAVVGVGALFPGSTTETGFWRDILAGRDLMTDVPASHWLVEDYYDADPSAPDKTYANRGAFLPPVDFDPLAFGVPPTIMPATDSAQLLALIVAQRVLQDAAKGQFQEMDKERISVILGVTSAQELLGSMVSRLQRPIWEKALRDAGLPESQVKECCQRIADEYVPWQESTFPGVLGNVVAGRIANRFDLHGTNCVTDAACASTFSAVSMAVNELYLGQSDLVVTGGVDTMNDIFMYMCFSKTPALSKSGDCRPFSDQADGTMLGEGIGMVALKRLADAERDGDRIYAVLKGVGSSSDGRAKSVYAPVPEGQARALRRAYELADHSPRTVELVEAHGTGTIAGDAAEFEGLKLAFGSDLDDTPLDDRQWCAIGSVKSQIGHTKAAAGAAGLFKIVMALHHRVLPPTIKVDKPNPKMALDASPFYINTSARPWVRGSDHPRRGSVSAFGFGGSNFHLALEEYTGDGIAPRRRVVSDELVALGAESPQALLSAIDALPTDGPDLLAFAAWSTAQSYAGGAARLAIVAKDDEDFRRKLSDARARIAKDGKTPFTLPTGVSFGVGDADGQLGFLFPGQGSQYLGMGADLAMVWPQALAAWDLAADVPMGDATLHQVVFPPGRFDDAARAADDARLLKTHWAQPAIGAASLALLEIVKSLGLRADALGGHSYGEVTALHAGGAMDAATMLRVARRRGELMTEAAEHPGAMTAVKAPIDAVNAALDGTDIAVIVANHNAPEQVVLSGPTEAIDAAEKQLTGKGLRFSRLNVATAFHSPVVADSAEPFGTFLAEQTLEAPAIPTWANALAAPYGKDGVADTLATAIAKPVRFVEQIESMYEAGVRTFVEVGPASVLTGLVGRILGDRPHQAIALDRKGGTGVTALLRGLAALVGDGRALSLAALWQGFEVPADPRTVNKPKMAIPVSGTNVGKPYPPVDGASARPGPNPERQPEVVVKEVVKEVIKEVPVEVPVQSPRAVSGQVSDTFPSGIPANSGGSADAWAATYQAMQRETAAAHAAWQQSMAETHLAFLQTVENSLGALSGQVVSGQVVSGQAVSGQVLPAAPSLPAMAAAPMPPQIAMPAPAPAAAAPVVAAPTPKAAAAPAPTPAAKPAPAPAAAAPGIDLNGLLLDVVADKTGYPADMLELSMNLEADLGIDSIKRVEILAAMQEQAPGLPEVDTSQMAKLQTLAEIVSFMGDAMPAGAATAAPVTSAPAAAPGIDLNGLLLDVVADKTGYPADMLELSMNLEADLGIDSIKRVEILAAMQEQAPGLPEVDTSQMAKLQTLAEIVSFMGDAMPAGAATAAPVTSAPAAAPGIDLNGLLLDVVADKTGYPADMLELSMNLEADLGIDSIKRVEILAAMQEQAPGLPEVDTSQMAKLQTLAEIVSFMGDAMPAGAVAAAPAAAPAAPGVDLTGLLLDVVADKTGYPADMLDLGMNLEADLGIDSIKRVEILAAMQEQAPGLPEVDTSQMAKLQTLAEIVSFMGDAMPAGAVAAAPAPAAAPGVDLTGLLLDVVADKTGYPADMLDLGMNLEADLGIDSIKRVEILAAMQEQAPGLPEVDTAQMAKLQTLAEIVSFMGASMPAPASGATAAPAAAPAPGIDLTGLLLDVVADKTGYPADMLDLGMNLEADLGIDSIKRVEILAAMQEQAPGLPEVDTAQMAKLQTLAEIVSFMGAELADGPANAAGAVATAAPASGATGVAVEEPVDPRLGRWALELIPTREVGIATPGLASARTALISDDGNGIATALAKALSTIGITAKVVGEVTDRADLIVLLHGLTPDADETVDAPAFRAARAQGAEFDGIFVTVQNTGGDFSGRVNPWSGGLSGLTKTAAQEWPNATCRAIDIDTDGRDAGAIASALLRELTRGGDTLEVGLSASGRLVPTSVPALLPDAPLSLGDAPFIVASGGARGVTAATLIALAEASDDAPRFALLGRSALADEPASCRGLDSDADLKRALLNDARERGEKPNPKAIGSQTRAILSGREIRETLAAIAAAGGEARYVSVDVTDAEGLSAALAPLRNEWGPVTGIVHGAGVLADKFIADKTDEQFERVHHTKVGGLRALLAACDTDPLRHLVLFSSVAARSGNQGQCDYAMANEILNKVATFEAARRPGCVVRALDWGPWAGGMVTPSLAAHFEALDVPLIPLREGGRMLVRELATGRGSLTHAEVVLGGPPRAEALLARSKPTDASFDLIVNETTYPSLRDHAINDAVVVPVVQVVAWFNQAARAARPDLTLAACRKVKVLKGIRLEHYNGNGDRFTVSTRLLSNGNGAVLGLQLLDSAGTPRYSAEAELTVGSLHQSPRPATPAVGEWSGTVYGDVLFHGPEFQVIEAVEGLNDDGITARMQSSDDIAVLDGGLQLALLYARHRLGGASLPTSVGAFRGYGNLADGPVQCTLKGRTVGKSKIAADVTFSRGDIVVAELEGVEAVLLPSDA